MLKVFVLLLKELSLNYQFTTKTIIILKFKSVDLTFCIYFQIESNICRKVKSNRNVETHNLRILKKKVIKSYKSKLQN